MGWDKNRLITGNHDDDDDGDDDDDKWQQQYGYIIIRNGSYNINII